MKLSRNQLLVIGIGIISFYYLLNKFEFIFAAERTLGKVTGQINSGATSVSKIEFIYNSVAYSFQGEPNVEYKFDESVPVIFLPKNPTDAYISSFLGFWYNGLLYSLVPLVFWCAFILSAYQEDDKIHFSFHKKKTEPADSIFNNTKKLE